MAKKEYFATLLYKFKTKKEKEDFQKNFMGSEYFAAISDFNIFDKKGRYEIALERIVDQGSEDDYEDKVDEIHIEIKKLELKLENIPLDLTEERKNVKERILFLTNELEELLEWDDPASIAKRALEG